MAVFPLVTKKVQFGNTYVVCKSTRVAAKCVGKCPNTSFNDKYRLLTIKNAYLRQFREDLKLNNLIRIDKKKDGIDKLDISLKFNKYIHGLLNKNDQIHEHESARKIEDYKEEKYHIDGGCCVPSRFEWRTQHVLLNCGPFGYKEIRMETKEPGACSCSQW